MSKKISLFNSFSFHHEMFGYIIHYCSQYNYELNIYTEMNGNCGWIDFYRTKFTDISLNLCNVHNFEINRYNYDLVFLITDDDPMFKNDWLLDDSFRTRVICIDHHFSNRRTHALHHIGTRPFAIHLRKWGLPCFPIVSFMDKIKLLTSNEIHIAIVGGSLPNKLINGKYNVGILNRFKSNYKIVIHAISRNITREMFEGINPELELRLYSSLSTISMTEILKKCNYLLTDVNNPQDDHVTGFSMSGAVPLAYSCLLPLIISKQGNSVYKFKICLEFDINTNDDIIVPNSYENKEYLYDLLNKERQELINMFFEFNQNVLIQNENHQSNAVEEGNSMNVKNTALIIEPRFLKNLPKLMNEYHKILGNKWKIVFYCGSGLKEKWIQKLQNDDIEIRELDKTNLTFEDYNNFCKERNLWKSLYGEYVLVFQSDTIIKNIEPYTIDNYVSLGKTYIGCNMFYNWNELVRENIFREYRNFNGGLSLRKREDMIRIIDTFGVESNVFNTSNKIQTDAEDVFFTLGSYKLNLPVGDDEFCSHFAIHTIYHEKFFGIHYSDWIPRTQLIEKYPELQEFPQIFRRITNEDYIE